MESVSEECEHPKELSGRKRKKLYNKLRIQMEFYFSDSNLAKDKFLYSLIVQDTDGYVDLAVFLTFNKIKAISEDVNFIASSLTRSSILEMNEDRSKVRRKDPINICKDFDACTLYVERLPPHADQKGIRDIFENFGTVEYINIPRFNISQKIKGFAFIEFSSPESVIKACQFFENSGKETDAGEEENTDTNEEKLEDMECKSKSMSSDSSVGDFSKKVVNKKCQADNNESIKSEKSEKLQEVKDKKTKRTRLDSSAKDSSEKVFFENSEKEIVAGEGKNTNEAKLEDMENRKAKRLCPDSNVGDVSNKVVNDKCQTDKNESIKCENSEIDRKQAISPRKERKRKLNNSEEDKKSFKKPKVSFDKNVTSYEDAEKYADLSDNKKEKTKPVDSASTHPENNSSVETMEDAAPTKTKKKRKHSKKNRTRTEQPALRVMSKSDWKSYRNKYLELQRTTMSFLKKQILAEAQEMRELENNSQTEHAPKKELAFQPGVILRIKLLQPVENPTALKEQIKARATAAYIDAPFGAEDVFIRCHTAIDAASIVQDNKLSNIGETQLLTGADEEKYWEKIKKDRKIKLSAPIIRKRRGRDKLIAKATKLLEKQNKHIYFDE